MAAYLRDSHTIVDAKHDNCKPYGQNQFGYGNKIATSTMIRIALKAKRQKSTKHWHRVYVMQCSNVASQYIIVKKQRLFLGNDLNNWAVG